MRTNLQITAKPNSHYILCEVTFSSARNQYIALEIYPNDIERYTKLRPQAHKQVVQCLFFLLYAGYKRENETVEDFRLDISSDINYLQEVFNLEQYTIIKNTRGANIVTKAKIQEYAKKWEDIQFTFKITNYVAQDAKIWVYWNLTTDIDTF